MKIYNVTIDQNGLVTFVGKPSKQIYKGTFVADTDYLLIEEVGKNRFSLWESCGQEISRYQKLQAITADAAYQEAFNKVVGYLVAELPEYLASEFCEKFNKQGTFRKYDTHRGKSEIYYIGKGHNADYLRGLVNGFLVMKGKA